MEERKKERKKDFEGAEGVGQENGSLKSIKIKHVDDKMHDASPTASATQR